METAPALSRRARRALEEPVSTQPSVGRSIALIVLTVLLSLILATYIYIVGFVASPQRLGLNFYGLVRAEDDALAAADLPKDTYCLVTGVNVVRSGNVLALRTQSGAILRAVVGQGADGSLLIEVPGQEEPQSIAVQSVIGKVTHSIGRGKVFDFFTSLTGFALVVFLPCLLTLVIVSISQLKGTSPVRKKATKPPKEQETRRDKTDTRDQRRSDTHINSDGTGKQTSAQTPQAPVEAPKAPEVRPIVDLRPEKSVSPAPIPLAPRTPDPQHRRRH